MSDVDDVVSNQLKLEEMEERKCADNICQQEIREKYRTWNYLGDLLNVGK